MKKLIVILTLSMLVLSCGKNDNGRYIPYVPNSENSGILDTHTGIIYQPIKDPPGTTDFHGTIRVIKVIETDYINRTKKQYDFVDNTIIPIEDK